MPKIQQGLFNASNKVKLHPYLSLLRAIFHDSQLYQDGKFNVTETIHEICGLNQLIVAIA
jgi:hypothetical protein